MNEIVQSSDDLIVIQTDSGATLLEVNGAVAGPKGESGSAGQDGKSVVWRGNYNSASSYGYLDLVRHAISNGGDNRLYICISPTTISGQAPSLTSNVWSLAVDRSPSGVVFGPYQTSQALGFVNSTGTELVLSNEVLRPANSANIEWRRVNGNTADVTVPVTLQPGDFYEVRLNGLTSDRVYVGYRAE